MNCQDISRIADSGSFNKLTEAERRAAEAHALSCRHCAPLWGVHSRLAELAVPPMPAEFAVHMRRLAALPAHAWRSSSLRRLTVIGSVVALAAAAGMLTVYLTGTRKPDVQHSAATVLSTSQPTASQQPAPVSLLKESQPAAVRKAAPALAEAVSAKPKALEALSPPPLPLLPAPVFPRPIAQDPGIDLALEKVADLHPELVQGPDTDDMFSVYITKRENGTLISSTVRQITLTTLRSAAYRDITAQLERTRPKDGGSEISGGRKKSWVLPDGRTLRGGVSLMISTVPNDYDATRSNVRVDELVRDRYANLLLPVADGKTNVLTIFIGADGNIQREDVELKSYEDLDSLRPGDLRDSMRLAQRVAARLALDVGQIGLMGSLSVQEGYPTVEIDASGNSTTVDKTRAFLVYYAWSRRDGESAPIFGLNGTPVPQKPLIDLAAALTIVKRQIPDAFIVKDHAAGTPTVVLTLKGELIRAGRVQEKIGPIDTTLREQLVPGVMTSSFMDVRLTDETGATADVLFAWEMPAADAEKLRGLMR